MRKVLLINPLSGYFKYDKMSMPPLGLLYIASHLRSLGIEVSFLDRNAYFYKLLNEDSESERLHLLDTWMLSEIQAINPDMCAFTMMTSQMLDVKHCSKLIKKKYKDEMPIVVGGYQATIEPAETLKYLANVDILIKGRGETAMGQLAQGQALYDIPNITYRSKTIKRSWLLSKFTKMEIHETSKARSTAIDELYYLPARDLLDMDFYSYPSDSIISCYYFDRPMSLITALGCNNNCNFCASRILENKICFKNVDSVIAEIDHLIQDYHATGLLFYDINFFLHKKRTQTLLQAIISTFGKDKLKWLASASATEISPELLSLARESGCVGLVFGFESGSNNMLRALNKTATVEDNQKAINMCRSNDIRPQSGFILGTPGETEQDILDTYKFIEKNNLLSSINLLLPLPGTPVNRLLIDQKRLNPQHRHYYGLIADHNRPVTPEIIFSNLDFKKFYSLLSYGKEKVCPPTWETIYVDNARHQAI